MRLILQFLKQDAHEFNTIGYFTIYSQKFFNKSSISSSDIGEGGSEFKSIEYLMSKTF